MTRAIRKKETQQDVEAWDAATSENDGLENDGLDDAEVGGEIGFLSIAHGTSDAMKPQNEAYVADLQFGNIYNTWTSRIYPGGVLFQPCIVKKVFCLWKGGGTVYGGMYDASSACVTSAKRSGLNLIASEGGSLVETIRLGGLAWCDVDEEWQKDAFDWQGTKPEPAFIHFAVARYKTGRRMVQKLRLLKTKSGNRIPMYGSLWSITTYEKPGEGGEYYTYKPVCSAMLDPSDHRVTLGAQAAVALKEYTEQLLSLGEDDASQPY